jgi:ABC-type Mn2+/Zn2+ transport system ATPase subunit
MLKTTAENGRTGRMPAVIEVQNLHKTYGDTVAVDDVSFTVQDGEIFGILGPNGAGKTTTVECIEGGVQRRPAPPEALRCRAHQRSAASNKQ